jgi:hypothetical protein
MYQQRQPPQEPPCHQCKVVLWEENEDDGRVYMLTRRQVVTAGMGQEVDISIPAVKIAMDLLGVKDQLACLNRVRKLFRHFMGKTDES